MGKLNVNISEIRNFLMGIKFTPEKNSFLNPDLTFKVPMRFKEFTITSISEFGKLVKQGGATINEFVSFIIKKDTDAFRVLLQVKDENGKIIYKNNRKVQKLGLIKYIYFLLSCSGVPEVRENVYGYPPHLTEEFLPVPEFKTLQKEDVEEELVEEEINEQEGEPFGNTVLPKGFKLQE